MLATVERLQRTLSDAAKASLDRRFGALFDKVYRKDVLWQAWRLVRANNGGPGIDGQTCDYIENEIGVIPFLAELRDELRTGTYRPQPVKRCWIDKPGRTRLICRRAPSGSSSFFRNAGSHNRIYHCSTSLALVTAATDVLRVGQGNGK